MNKQDLVRAVSDHSGLKKKDAAAAVDAFLATVVSTVVAGDDVSLAGFGVFRSVDKPARKCRNPITGGTVDVPAKRAVRFRVGSTFKAAVNA